MCVAARWSASIQPEGIEEYVLMCERSELLGLLSLLEHTFNGRTERSTITRGIALDACSIEREDIHTISTTSLHTHGCGSAMDRGQHKHMGAWSVGIQVRFLLIEEVRNRR